MLGAIPFGGIQSTGQSTGQAVTTAAAQLSITGGTAVPSTGDRAGDPAVKADPTNSRIQINAPGIYEITLEMAGAAASALQTTHQLRKGVGTMTAFGKKTKKTWATTPDTVTLTEIVEVTTADLPSTGGVATFADPSASAGVGKPSGGFAGAGAAPKNGIYIDSQVTGDGSVTLTPTDISFTAKRIG